jgi:tRNA pseudouridine55 synthase
VSETGTSPTPAAAAEALRAHLGWGEQAPPATSARKIGGEPAYRKAHRGEHVELPPSRVYLHAAEWLSHDAGGSRLRITCRGGYYVRALARDLGRALRCGAHLRALTRTAHGPWTAPAPTQAAHVRGRDALPWLPAARLDAAALKTLRREGRLGTDLPLETAVWTAPSGSEPAFPYVAERTAAVHDDRLLAVLRRSPDGWEREIDLLRGI